MSQPKESYCHFSGKRKFSSPAVAMKATRKLERKRNPYKCRYCKAYHVTTQKQEPPRKRPRPYVAPEYQDFILT